MLAFAIIGLFSLGFFLLMFRLWIDRYRGLELPRLLIEGMGLVVVIVLARMLIQAVILVWTGERAGAFTNGTLSIGIGIVCWIQVVRFAYWWLRQTPAEASLELEPDEGE